MNLLQTINQKLGGLLVRMRWERRLKSIPASISIISYHCTVCLFATVWEKEKSTLRFAAKFSNCSLYSIAIVPYIVLVSLEIPLPAELLGGFSRVSLIKNALFLRPSFCLVRVSLAFVLSFLNHT